MDVFANTEVGLSDQLKELSLRVKSLERDLVVADEQRVVAAAELDEEKLKRRLSCDPRTLSSDEKSACKTCVQNLLTAAKASLSLEGAGGSDGASDEETAAESDAIIERSQEVLYDTVEGMDKAVLVELCTALGGLVQTMYIEREKMKQDEIQRQQRRSVVKAEKEAKLKADIAVEESKTKIETEVKTVHAFHYGHGLSDETASMLMSGATFIKHSRLGSRDIRYVWLTPDLLNICWRQIGNMQSQNSMPLRDFDL